MTPYPRDEREALRWALESEERAKKDAAKGFYSQMDVPDHVVYHQTYERERALRKLTEKIFDIKKF